VVDISASNPNLGPDFEGVNPDALAAADGVFGSPTPPTSMRASGSTTPARTSRSPPTASRSRGGTTTSRSRRTSRSRSGSLDARGEVAGTQLGADEFSIRGEVAEPESVPSSSDFSTGDGGPTITVTSPSDDRREFVASDIDHDDTVRFEADGMHLDGENVTLDRLDLAGVRNEHIEVNAAGSPEPFANGSALDAPTTPRPIAYLGVEHDFDPDEVDAMTIRFSASRETLDDAGIDPKNVTLYRQTDAGNWAEKGASVADEDVVRIRGLSEDRVHFRATTDGFSTFAVAERVPAST